MVIITHYGEQALHMACRSAEAEAMGVLVAARASLEAAGRDGATPLRILLESSEGGEQIARTLRAMSGLEVIRTPTPTAP